MTPIPIVIGVDADGGHLALVKLITEAVCGAGYSTYIDEGQGVMRSFFAGGGQTVSIVTLEADHSQRVRDISAVLNGHSRRVARPGAYRVYREDDRVIYEPFDGGDPYVWDTDDQEAGVAADAPWNIVMRSQRIVDCGMSVRTSALVRNRFGGDCTLQQIADKTDADLREVGFSEASVRELRGVVRHHQGEA